MAENIRRFGNGTVVPQSDPISLAGAICTALSGVGFADSEKARQAVASFSGPERIARLHHELWKSSLAR